MSLFFQPHYVKKDLAIIVIHIQHIVLQKSKTSRLTYKYLPIQSTCQIQNIPEKLHRSSPITTTLKIHDITTTVLSTQ